jgi:hypothetical protein
VPLNPWIVVDGVCYAFHRSDSWLIPTFVARIDLEDEQLIVAWDRIHLSVEERNIMYALMIGHSEWRCSSTQAAIANVNYTIFSAFRDEYGEKWICW